MKTPLAPSLKNLRLNTQKTKGGKRYVFAYQNRWNPFKHQSRTIYREEIGYLKDSSNLIHFSKKFLDRHPEFKGRLFYYQNHEMQELVEPPEASKSEFAYQDCLHIGVPWSCWMTAVKHGIREDLIKVFADDGDDILRLAIYCYLEPAGLCGYAHWLSGHWLPRAKPMESQRISELLARIDPVRIKEYYRKRFDRCILVDEKAEPVPSIAGKRFLALDSTSIGTYSETIEKAAFGKAKKDPELQQVNIVLAVNYKTGDTCYAFMMDGSITDKGAYGALLVDMMENGFDLNQVVLVTDRGFESLWNLLKMLKANIGYVTGVPLVEKGVKEKFLKYKESFLEPALWSDKLDVAGRSFTEDFTVGTSTGNLRKQPWLHLYRNLRDGYDQVVGFFHRLGGVLELKNKKLAVSSEMWREYGSYCIEKDGKWSVNQQKMRERAFLSGCFALRSDCISHPFVCLQLYRDRNIVEEAFRQFRGIGGDRFRTTNSSYQGKLFLYLLAQSLKMIQITTARHNETPRLKIPNHSLPLLLKRLDAIFALRTIEGDTWVVPPIPKSARDALTLLGLKESDIPSTITRPQL